MNYQSPTLKVVEFKVERGFEGSGVFTKSDRFPVLEMESPCNEESYSYHHVDGETFWLD